ncbi:MAG: glycosyltransferase family 1 protein [Bacteroidales bacterium]|nr:glycosyltransferase family 1 protein [Bacteroidales bacterium]
MAKEMHMVAFNVPWPANYGGIMDVYYRLKTLSEAGVKVHLHCFAYGRDEAPELLPLCASVNYYNRNMSPLLHLQRTPFIVASRCNDELSRRLASDRLPVLLEGVHCCSLLEQPEVTEGRTTIVRAHNVEADYYALLAATERNPLRRAYLWLDSTKLRRYEAVMARATAVLAVTEADRALFETMGCRNVRVMTSEHPYTAVTSRPGLGTYALYHANLSVPENEAAAEYLAVRVFAHNNHRLVVAGFDPSPHLRRLLEKYPNITLEANPDDARMADLLAEAQATILMTHQPTGLKLKLLNSLFGGRHCIVNSNMVAGTALAPLCEVADTPEAMIATLNRVMSTPFTAEQVAQRAEALDPLLNRNAIRPLLELI